MQAVVFYLLLFGYFVYLVVPDDSEITVIPLSACPFDGNSTTFIKVVKKALASEGNGDPATVNSKMLVHCYVDKNNPQLGGVSWIVTTEEQRSLRFPSDCSCQPFLIEVLSSKEDIDPDGSLRTWIDLDVIMAYWKMINTTLAYVVVVIFIIRIYQDWRPSIVRSHSEIVVENNSTDSSNVSSSLLSSSSRSSSNSGAFYVDPVSGMITREPRFQDEGRFSDFSSPRSSSPDSGSSRMESAETEISELEKLLASGSAVIIKGSYPIVTPSDAKTEGSIGTSESSYVHDIGEGLGEIYHEPQSRLLVTRSAPRSIQNLYYLQDPIFYTCTSSPEELWLRVQSLPNIHQVYHHSTIKESFEDSTIGSGQIERCGSVSPCSSNLVRYSKESLGEDDFAAAESQTERCNSVSPCSSDLVRHPMEIFGDDSTSAIAESELRDSGARYAGSVELIGSGAVCERRASERFWESMYNIGACSEYFSESIYRSWPCIHPLWMFSDVESFNGLTGTGESSLSLPEDHLQCDVNVVLSNQGASIQHGDQADTGFEAGSHVDFVQGEAMSDDYGDHERSEIQNMNESFEQCIGKAENIWGNLKEEANRQIVVPFAVHAAKVLLVEFAMNW